MKQKYNLFFKRAHTYENVEMLSRLRTVSFIMVRGLSKYTGGIMASDTLSHIINYSKQ